VEIPLGLRRKAVALIVSLVKEQTGGQLQRQSPHFFEERDSLIVIPGSQEPVEARINDFVCGFDGTVVEDLHEKPLMFLV
jgi:hypothetical protein